MLPDALAPALAPDIAQTRARRAAVALVVLVAAAWVITAGAVALVLVLLSRRADAGDWWLGLLAAGTASLLAAGASAGPILVGLGRGSLDSAVVGYFVALGVRAVVSLAGCAVAVYAGGYPRTATFLLMVPFYLAILAAETYVVGRYAGAMKS